MGDWIDIGSVNDYQQGKHKCTSAGGRSIIVFHVDGRFHAMLNFCPHAGLPMDNGEFTGKAIVCPFHHYAYSIEDGRNLDWPDDELPAKILPVRVVDGVVQVGIAMDNTSPPRNHPPPAAKPNV